MYIATDVIFVSLSCVFGVLEMFKLAYLQKMSEKFVSFSQTPLSDIPLQTVYVHHIHVQSVRWIPGRGGQRAVTSPHYTFHDTWSAVCVCVLEPCSLPFAVESWTPAGRSRLVVWPHRSLGSCLFFFSPQESLLGQQSTESVEPRLERFGFCSGLMVVCAC